MKVSVLTLGCKVNQAESALIEGALKSSGHDIVNLSEKPNVCIINTCTVTSKSDYQSRQLIRRAQRGGARIIVTGCYSELNKAIVKSMEGVTEVVDNNKKLNIVNSLTGKSPEDASVFPVEKRSRFFIKIQDGCDYSCSYCAIPMARGASRSINPDSIIEKINAAVIAGYNEVVLTGIHLGTYGHDLEPKVKLSNLIVTILNKTTINRIRLSSLEIREVDDEILELLSEKRICNHLHIPLQSGDNKVLKLMKRTYDAEYFSNKILDIYKRAANISIGTDVIVGFPGEDDSEFQNTYNLLERNPVSYIHIFPFSPRPGTEASEMRQSTPSKIIKKRAAILESLNKEKKVEYMSKQVGKYLDVLIEGNDRNGLCCGTTGNYLKIFLPPNEHLGCESQRLCGSLILVRVEGIRESRLVGIPIM